MEEVELEHMLRAAGILLDDYPGLRRLREFRKLEDASDRIKARLRRGLEVDESWVEDLAAALKSFRQSIG